MQNNDSSLKLLDKFTYLGTIVSHQPRKTSTRDEQRHGQLSIDYWSDLTDKMKLCLYQAAVLSILLYGCTTGTLTKRMEKNLDGNCTKMLRGILNKTWRQHPIKPQLNYLLPPNTKTIKIRLTRHTGPAGEVGMSS